MREQLVCLRSFDFLSGGTIATPLVESLLNRRSSTAEEAGTVYPMKRIGKPSEIARVVLSPSGSFDFFIP